MIYESTIQYTTTKNKGVEVLKSEKYILENVSLFCDVEERMLKTFIGYKDVDVTAIRRSKIREIANNRNSEDDLIWIAEVEDVFLTEEGEEKRTKYKIAFYSKTFDSAKAYITEYTKQGYNLGIVSLKCTNFVEIL